MFQSHQHLPFTSLPNYNATTHFYRPHPSKKSQDPASHAKYKGQDPNCDSICQCHYNRQAAVIVRLFYLIPALMQMNRGTSIKALPLSRNRQYYSLHRVCNGCMHPKMAVCTPCLSLPSPSPHFPSRFLHSPLPFRIFPPHLSICTTICTNRCPSTLSLNPDAKP